MRKIIICMLCLLPVAMYGQDTTYLDKHGDKIRSRAIAVSYRLTVADSTIQDGIIEREYYLSGKIKSESHLIKKQILPQTNKKWNSKEGKFKMWYENGKIRREIDYYNNLLDGNLITYWENGKLKRRDIFKKGKLAEGKCYTEEGYETDYYPFETMPEFPGGEKELLSYISRNLRYPVNAMEARIQGTTIIRFLINTKGEITNIKVLRSLSTTTDQEACRVIRQSPLWKPGTQEGEPINVFFTLPIKYKLE
ncbi:MAG: TonB family protein [Paludibacter sp.]